MGIAGSTASFSRRARILRHLCTAPTATASIDPTVKRLVRSRRLSEVEPHLEHLKTTGDATSEAHLSSIILSYGFAKMLDHASRTFDHMDHNTSRTALSLNALLTSFTHAGHHARVPHLFSDLSKKHSITPNTVTYGILIKALCQSGTPEKAFPILKEMEKKGVEISTITYTPIVDALYKKGMTEEAEKAWAEMVERGCIPDVAAYNVRAMNRAHHGRPDDVLKVFDEMREADLEPDIITYNHLITCYCKNGKFLDAKSLYKSLGEKKLYPKSATYRNFMYFLCKNGDFGAAYKVCKDGIRRNRFPDIGPAKMLVKGLVGEKREEDAMWLMRQFKRKYPPTLAEALRKMEEEIGLRVNGEDSVDLEASSS